VRASVCASCAFWMKSSNRALSAAWIASGQLLYVRCFEVQCILRSAVVHALQTYPYTFSCTHMLLGLFCVPQNFITGHCTSRSSTGAAMQAGFLLTSGSQAHAHILGSGRHYCCSHRLSNSGLDLCVSWLVRSLQCWCGCIVFAAPVAALNCTHRTGWFDLWATRSALRR
jgi:hypothetical protein